MNFLCEKCKQKYHVADEKLAGRAVTRFRCKKCDNVIELHAPTATQSASPEGGATAGTPAPVARPATQAVPIARGSARPRPATSTGPAYGAVPARQATMPPTSGGRAPSTSATSSENGWYAGIRDVPVGPLSRKDLASRVAAGDVLPDTLVWREGLDDWRPLQAVAELNDLMRAAVSAVESSKPLAPRPAVGSAGSRAAPRPSVVDDDEEATRVSGLDPSLAGIMARSLRTGADGSKPGVTEKSVAERPKQTTPLSPFMRTPTRAATPATPTPASTAKPVEKPVEKPFEKAAEKTAERSSEPAAEQSAVFPPPARSVAEQPARSALRSSSEEEPLSGPAVVARQERISVTAPFAPTSGAVEKAPITRSASGDSVITRSTSGDSVSSKPPSMDDFNAALPDDLFVPTAATAPAASSARPDAPPLSPALVMPPTVQSTNLAPPPVPAATATPHKGGSLPVGAWVLMVGVLVAGIGGGVYIGRLNQQPVQPDAPRPLRSNRPLPLPVADATPATAVNDATALSTDAAPLATDAAPSTATASPRALEIAQGFRDSRVVNTCWQSTLRQNPTLNESTVTIEVSVDAQGHYSRVSVSESPDPRFEACLRSHLGDVAAVSAGEAADARTSVTLSVRR